MRPENQAVAHRLGLFWFGLPQWKILGRNDEDEVLVDSFVYSWSYGQVLHYNISTYNSLIAVQITLHLVLKVFSTFFFHILAHMAVTKFSDLIVLGLRFDRIRPPPNASNMCAPHGDAHVPKLSSKSRVQTNRVLRLTAGGLTLTTSRAPIEGVTAETIGSLDRRCGTTAVRLGERQGGGGEDKYVTSLPKSENVAAVSSPLFMLLLLADSRV